MERYDAREEALGEELMGALERFLLLQMIDERWREHLFDMDYLREGIHLRGFAQIDPLVAYKNEAFTLFGDLMNSVWTDFARMIFNVEVNVEGENGHASAPPSFTPAGSATRAGRISYSGGHSAAGSGALAAAAAAAGVGAAEAEGELEALPVVEQRVLDDDQQLGRNDPCWCGSGKKFKKCHGASARALRHPASRAPLLLLAAAARAEAPLRASSRRRRRPRRRPPVPSARTGGAKASIRSPSPRTNTPRRLENSRKPSMPWWRPEPLWPMPPKGSDGSAPWTAAEFTHAPPEVVRRSTSSATAARPWRTRTAPAAARPR